MIFGDRLGLTFPDICLTGEEKPRNNLTHVTCPDRGKNPGPLRDKRACYRLFHSGGEEVLQLSKSSTWIFLWISILYHCHVKKKTVFVCLIVAQCSA